MPRQILTHLFLFQQLDELHSVTANSQSNRTKVGTRSSHRSIGQTLSGTRRQRRRSNQDSTGRTKRRSLSAGITRVVVAHVRLNSGGPEGSSRSEGRGVGDEDAGQGNPVINLSAISGGLQRVAGGAICYSVLYVREVDVTQALMYPF